MPASANHQPIQAHYDVVLIGGGIMSATLGTMLHELNPNLKIVIFERLGRFARESSAAWNNAGTGHSAFCELNYTPQNEDGSIDISKAESIAEQFEISKQFCLTYSLKSISKIRKTLLIRVRT